MSFGFSVGDFLTILQLANTVRQKWEDAPGEYATIKDETKNVSSILQNLGELSKRAELSPEQKLQVQNACDSCRPVLQRCETLAEKCPSEQSAVGGRAKFKRVWKRLQLDPDDVRTLRQQLVSCVNILNALLTIVQSVEIFEIRKGVEDIRSHEARVQNKPIADWYSLDSSGKHQDDLMSLRHRGTGLWVLDDPKYEQWWQGHGSTLLCPGIPGSGKSIMNATMVNDLRARFETENDVIVTYYYCSFKRQAEQTVRNVLAVLVRQLFQERPNIPSEVQELYNKYHPRQETPSTEELSSLMYTLMRDYRKIYVLIDALDEWMDVDGNWTEFLQEIFTVQQQSDVDLNILATTRFVPEIEEQFGSCPHLEIRANQGDIEHYLDHNISRLSVKPHVKVTVGNSTVTVRDAVKSQIADAADGMFLLARLQFESLIDKTTPRKLQLALAQLQKGSKALNAEYDKALNRIDQQREGFRQLAQKVLACIVHAHRELSIGELQEAVAIEEGMEDINHTTDLEEEQQLASVCAGLVRIDHEAGVIRLVHYTTQEYLLGVSYDRLGGERIIAQSCLQYLNMDVFRSVSISRSSELATIFQKYKFLRYAGKNWYRHANSDVEEEYVLEIDEMLSKPELQKLLGQIIFARSSVATGRLHMRPLSKVTPAHIYARLGLVRMMSHVIDRGDVVDAKNSVGETPLFLAAQQGHNGVVRVLLQQSTVDVNSKTINGVPPLLCAAEGGHVEAVKIILQRPDVVTTVSEGWYESPLTAAARSGCVEAMKLLLERPEVKVEVSDSKFEMAFLAAIRHGRLEVVKFLMSQSDICINGHSGTSTETPLSCAAKHGQKEIVELLLEQPEIETMGRTTDYNKTALDLAILGGHAKIVRIFLKRVEYISLLKQSGLEASILSAARCGNAEVLQVFFDPLNTDLPRPNLNHEDENGQTALSLAAIDGESYPSNILRFLLGRAEVDPNFRNSRGWPPIFFAINAHRWGNVKALLDRDDIDVDIRDELGRTPLIFAVANGYAPIVALLLMQPGVNVNARDEAGRTPLSWAAEGGDRDIVSLLLKQPDLDMEMKDNGGRTPLSWAIEKGEIENARLLLQHLYSQRHPCQVQPADLQEAIQGLCPLLNGRSFVDAYFFNDLGHSFKYLGETELALAAFRRYMKTETETLQAVHDGIACDGCDRYPILGSRFVCMTCPDLDLCLTCRDKHRSDSPIASCVTHEFLEVPGADYVWIIADNSD